MTSSTQPNGGRSPIPRSSNLRWILGVGGGAFSGGFVGAVLGHVCLHDEPSGIGVLVGLAVGASIGGLFPPIGSLSGLGAIVAFLAAVYVDIVAVHEERIGNKMEETLERLFLILPLGGGGIGLLWSMIAWGWRHKQHHEPLPLDREAVATARRDRILLAWICLIAGVTLGVGFGIRLGGPFIVRGSVIGVVVGGTMFIGLLISALFSGRRK